MATKVKSAQNESNTSSNLVYPEVKSEVFNEKPITVEMAKDLLGWEEEPEEGNSFGSDYLLLDVKKKKIRCKKNMKNRPLYMSNVDSLVQELLMRRWQMNGEPIIISNKGNVLNGQHTLIALILAEQHRTGKDKDHWKSIGHKEPVSLRKIIVYGIDEDDSVINTMDTCKPRSLADVVYRSKFFNKLKGPDRKLAARALDHSVKMLWCRTGADQNPFAPKRTHTEALDFINRHPNLVKAVKQVMEYDNKGSISNYVSLGYASALLYLMAACSDDGDEYRNMEVPSEKGLKLNDWDKACEFWANLSEPILVYVRQALAILSDSESTIRPRLADKIAILAKAWWMFRDGKELTKKNMTVKWVTDENTGATVMLDPLDFAGIDIGDPSYKEPSEDITPKFKTKLKLSNKITSNKEEVKEKEEVQTEESNSDELIMFEEAENYSSGFSEDNEEEQTYSESDMDSDYNQIKEDTER